MSKPVNANVRLSFAGISFKTTTTSKVRRGAMLKILRSGKVRVTCKGSYTDDYKYDADTNFGRGVLSDDAVARLARDIERSPSGWWCSAYQRDEGELHLGCHSFKSYKLEAVGPTPDISRLDESGEPNYREIYANE